MAFYDFTVALQAADVNGIAESQTPLAGGNLTLDGILMDQASIDENGHARQVLLTFAADETGRTFVVTGKLTPNGADVSESVAGGVGTATTVSFFIEMTSISIDAAAAGAIQAGTNGVGASVPKPLDHKAEYIAGYQHILTGTANFTLQHTYGNPFDRDETFVWFDDAAGAKSANFAGTFTMPVRASRLKVNSGTGSVRTILAQADSAH